MAVACGVTNVAVPVSVAAGTASDCQAMGDKTVTLESAGTATYQLQISCDPANPPASASWQAEQAALTASGAIYIQRPCMWVRWNCTAYTNGTPLSHLCGVTHY
jgi:hypothetical protein